MDVFTPPTLPVPDVAHDWLARVSDGDPEALVEAAREFEAILLRQMLKGLRELFATESDEGDGFGGDALFDTIESELARHLSDLGGLGLADRLVGSPAGRAIGGDQRRTPPETAVAPVVAGPAGAPDGRTGAVSPPPFGAAVTSGFGWRTDPIDGQQRFHAGVDVRAAFGDAVPAVRGGRVAFVGEEPGYGLTVVVGHEPGVTTRYAHLSALLVRSGDQIGPGQLIGRVGQSGRATGPHLHFEMVRYGRRVDPAVASVEMGQVRFKESDQDADFTVKGIRSPIDPLGAE